MLVWLFPMLWQEIGQKNENSTLCTGSVKGSIENQTPWVTCSFWTRLKTCCEQTSVRVHCATATCRNTPGSPRLRPAGLPAGSAAAPARKKREGIRQEGDARQAAPGSGVRAAQPLLRLCWSWLGTHGGAIRTALAGRLKEEHGTAR